MEFLIEYGVFLAKAITIVVAIILVIGTLANLGNKNKKQTEGHIEITNMSEDYKDIKDGMLEELLSEEEYKTLQKEKKKQEKLDAKEEKKRLKEEKKQSKKKQQVSQSKETQENTEDKIGRASCRERVSSPV